jgi:hypothetical protein
MLVNIALVFGTSDRRKFRKSALLLAVPDLIVVIQSMCQANVVPSALMSVIQTLVKMDSVWKIQGLHLDSDAVVSLATQDVCVISTLMNVHLTHARILGSALMVLTSLHADVCQGLEADYVSLTLMNVTLIHVKMMESALIWLTVLCVNARMVILERPVKPMLMIVTQILARMKEYVWMR